MSFEMNRIFFFYLVACYFGPTISREYAHAPVNAELSAILTKLWNVDHNRCSPGTDYTLNLQGYVTSINWNLTDRARQTLFTEFDEAAVFAKPTFRAFKALLDNYAHNTGEREVETDAEKREINNFLTLTMETDVMKETQKFLAGKRKISRDPTMFKNLLRNLWFKLYKRLHQDSYLNSCGFEHVFVGEKRSHEVTGLHNWIQFYLQEKEGNIDYRGYFRRGTTEEMEVHPRLMTLQFVWNRTAGKGISSMFVGSSPELEMAMYTLVHVLGLNRQMVDIHQYKLEIVTYAHGNSIGSAFPRSLNG